MLTLDLLPGNELVVAHVVDGAGGERVIARASYRLRDELAARTRASLLRVRPAALTGIDDATLPSGCHSFPLDTLPATPSVVFIDREERIGISLILNEADCDSIQAEQARALVSDVLSSLPGRDIVERFPD
ncbi:MAG: hypothetical protein ACK4K7_06525 [Allosphingosinicella sp.]|uniref:hypothetical protein n=1 Tax=Allosphingosinicella sp. TaxID=2823234 RepID=UPI00393CD055